MSESAKESRETLRALAEKWKNYPGGYVGPLARGVLGLLDALAEAERERDAMATTARELEDAAEREDELRRRLSKAEAVVERQREALQAVADAFTAWSEDHNDGTYAYYKSDDLMVACVKARAAVSGGESAEPQEEQVGRSGL